MAEQLKLEITADASKAISEIARTTSSLRDIVSSAAQVGAAYFAITTTLNKVSAIFSVLTTAASEQERAELGLDIALRNLGNTSIATRKALIDYASSVQKTTGIEDSLIIESEKLLTTFGLSEAQIIRATKASLNFSTAQGIDLRSAVILLGKAFIGQTETLGRYGIKIDESLGKHEKFSAIIEQLERRFGGFSDLLGTDFVGSQKRAASAVGELWEELGFFITKSPQVKKGIEGVINTVDRLTDALRMAREGNTGFIGFLKEFAIGAGKDFIHLKNQAFETANSMKEDFLKAVNAIQSAVAKMRGLEKENSGISISVFREERAKGVEEKPKPIIPQVDIDPEKIEKAESELKKLQEQFFPEKALEIQLETRIKSAEVLPTNESLDLKELALKDFDVKKELLDKEKREKFFAQEEALGATRSAINQTMSLERSAAQEKIDIILSSSGLNNEEKIGRLESLRDMHDEEIVQWTEFNETIKNLNNNRVEETNALEMAFFEKQNTLRQASLEAELGVLSEKSAAILAHEESQQAFFALKNELMIEGSKTTSDAIVESMSTAALQGYNQLGDAIAGAIVNNENLGESMKAIGKQMIATIISIMVQWVIAAALMRVLALLGLKTQIGIGAAHTGIWTAAAFMRTIAELGPIVGPPAFESLVAATPIYQAQTAAFSSAAGAAGLASALTGAVTSTAGLIFVHPNEIIAPEQKLIQIFKASLNEDRGRGVIFGEGAISITVNNPESAEIDIDEIADALGESVRDII